METGLGSRNRWRKSPREQGYVKRKKEFPEEENTIWFMKRPDAPPSKNVSHGKMEK